MRGLLGNSNGTIKPWWLPFDWCFCRVSINYKLKTIIVHNTIAPNVYDLPVDILNGWVVGIRTLETLPNISNISKIQYLNPEKAIFINNHKEILVTRNFSDTNPKWKKYKRMKYAIRYLYHE
jgi:hypothetical protein